MLLISGRKTEDSKLRQASIPYIHSALNFLLNAILICYRRQTFEFCHIFSALAINYYRYIFIFSFEGEW
jgi:hypothetical protein